MRNTLVSLLILLMGVSGCSKEEAAAPEQKVAVMKVMKRDVPLYSELVGQTIGSVDVAIRARVDGQLQGVHFREGQQVEKGQQLYSIDPQPFEMKVVGVRGEVAEARTALTKAKADLTRVEPLAKMNAVSKRDLDAAIAAKQSAEAALNTAKAKLASTELELGYARIQAPVSGIIGISKAKVGDYVGKDPNPVVLNTISQIDPIHVRVTLSERDYLSFARRRLQEQSNGNDPSKQKRDLQLILADGSVHQHPGIVVAADNQVDSTTGTLTVETSFPNPDLLLRPGQYAKIRFIREVKKDALVVWQRAVHELQDIYQVYIVTPENTVAIKQVKPGEKVQGLWIVEQGLSPDDRVIVEGVQRVGPGMVVEPLSPEALNVTPPESALLRQESAA